MVRISEEIPTQIIVFKFLWVFLFVTRGFDELPGSYPHPSSPMRWQASQHRHHHVELRARRCVRPHPRCHLRVFCSKVGWMLEVFGIGLVNDLTQTFENVNEDLCLQNHHEVLDMLFYCKFIVLQCFTVQHSWAFQQTPCVLVIAVRWMQHPLHWCKNQWHAMRWISRRCFSRYVLLVAFHITHGATWTICPPENSHIPSKGGWEDEFPFPKVRIC